MTTAIANHDNCPTTPSKSPSRSSNNNLGTTTSNNIINNTIASIISNKIDILPRSVQFASLATCVFFFFGIHNVLQEAMVNTEGFSFGVMLGWMEVLGVTLCSGLERSSVSFIGNGEGKRQRLAPWQAYPPLTICLLTSSSLASWSLNYINFPTKVVFRSCKLLPTMLIAYVMGNAKRFTYVEVVSAMAVCSGLITFAAGDWSLSKPQFHPFGLTLVTLSVFADAVLPNAQESLFRTYDASKSEVMFFTNIYTLVVQTGSAILSGDLMGFYRFLMGKPNVQRVNSFPEITGGGANSIEVERKDFSAFGKEMAMESTPREIRHTFILYMMAYIIISHIAVSAHTAVVKKFGGVAAVYVGTARKGMTLILSFVLFPKESNWKYAAGAILVLGGLVVASLEKHRNKCNTVIQKNTMQLGTSLDSKKKGSERDRKYLASSLPLSNDLSPPGHIGNADDINQMKEHHPLINLDVELGRSSSIIGNGPERRR